MELEHKLAKLRRNLSKMGNIVIAFSGGVDSTFLLMVAKDILKNNVLAVTVCSPFFPSREYNEAMDFTKRHDIKHRVFEVDLLNIEEISNNQPYRCYRCKHKIFERIKNAAIEENITSVADGSNVDDLNDYRPGMKALKELKIVSPLKEAGLNKEEIRFLSHQMGLKTWDKPAYACLASRFPYGQKITKEKLAMVDRAEQYLLDIGFKQIRVRHHGDIARIEVGIKEREKFYDEKLMDLVYEKFKEIGFSYTAMDLKGYRTGSLNENIIDSTGI